MSLPCIPFKEDADMEDGNETLEEEEIREEEKVPDFIQQFLGKVPRDRQE